GLAAALLLVVGVGGGGAWAFQHQQQAQEAEASRRRQEADEAALQAMGEARSLLAQAKAAPPGETALYRQALTAALNASELARAGGASDTVQGQAAALVNDLTREADAADRDRRLLVALMEVRGPREGTSYR